MAPATTGFGPLRSALALAALLLGLTAAAAFSPGAASSASVARVDVAPAELLDASALDTSDAPDWCAVDAASPVLAAPRGSLRGSADGFAVTARGPGRSLRGAVHSAVAPERSFPGGAARQSRWCLAHATATSDS